MSDSGIEGLDRLDCKLLRVLQADGRITTAELSERIGLSPTATADRIKRLTRDGFILGYRARLDPAKIGRGLLVFVEVLLDRTSPDVFDSFAAQVKRAGEVLECHLVAGGFDYLIKARVKDMTAYRAFLADVILPLPGVRETRTYAVMEEIKAVETLPI
ncbi:DNA-binding transcriptional dual regulator, leucine-binding [uncultured Alphaproteobacteria bacterium]|uniref:DNA-binding transcriptional dual regulator, leucine-binding n=1 Tax=uncultured Alphaproteobacteria bacterium TaxID=91750 RepID=A0A212KCX9_9PROT|nr:DNA-binding transcriptional dual regulator, leucine-binding [uncultured Alphaproteobacteria bacterium]